MDKISLSGECRESIHEGSEQHGNAGPEAQNRRPRVRFAPFFQKQANRQAGYVYEGVTKKRYGVDQRVEVVPSTADTAAAGFDDEKPVGDTVERKQQQ